VSVEAISWALNDAPNVPPACLAVLVGLANHAHANGRGAYPSQERLAHYARKSVRAVRNDLAQLERLGLIRRGDQRHTAFLPTDRRPIVWDLAMERRRPVPVHLDVNAEPRSGRPADVPEPVENREEVGFRAEADDRPCGTERPEAQYRPTGSRLPTNRPLTIKNHKRPRAPKGAALPVDNQQQKCARHRGNPAQNCGPCRSERIGGSR
jgi:hypothetical protein